MCFIPRLVEFECQGQISKVKVTRDKKQHFSALSAACVRFMFGKTSLASSRVYIYRYRVRTIKDLTMMTRFRLGRPLPVFTGRVDGP